MKIALNQIEKNDLLKKFKLYLGKDFPSAEIKRDQIVKIEIEKCGFNGFDIFDEGKQIGYFFLLYYRRHNLYGIFSSF